MPVDPFSYELSKSESVTISISNANGYEWGFMDACRQANVAMPKIPDGWCYAWAEYRLRNTSAIAIREGFAEWIESGTLPGLS